MVGWSVVLEDLGGLVRSCFGGWASGEGVKAVVVSVSWKVFRIDVWGSLVRRRSGKWVSGEVTDLIVVSLSCRVSKWLLI